MYEAEVVQERDRAEQLAREGLDVRAGEGHEATLFQEVEDGQAEEGCDDADVAPPVEAVAKLDAAVPVGLVSRTKGLEDAEFYSRSVSVLDNNSVSSLPVDAETCVTYLRHCSYDLHSHFSPCSNVQCLHDFTKSALPKELQEAVSLAEPAVLVNNIMPVFVIDLVISFMSLQGRIVSHDHPPGRLGEEPYIMYCWHIDLLLLLVLLRRWDIFSILRQIPSRPRPLCLLLLPLLFRIPRSPLPLLTRLRSI